MRLDPDHEPAHILTGQEDPVDRDRRRASSTSTPGRARGPARSAEGLAEHQPDWYKSAVFYEVLVRAFATPTATAPATSRGLIEKLDYLQWLGVDCLWLPPFYASPLRDGGYDIADFTGVLPEFGTLEDFHDLARRGPRARHAGHHRPGHEPHLATSTRGSRSPARPRGPVRRLLRVERHRRPATTTRASSSSTPSPPTGPGTRCASSTSGTASSATSRTSTSTTPRCTRRCSTSLRSGSTWASTGSGSTRCPTCSSARAPTARTCPETHDFLKRGAAGSSTTEYPDRVLLAEANQWPADVVDYFGDRGRRRVPHGLPLPGDAAHLHGRAPGVALPDLGDPGSRRRPSRTTASGASSCATTTS